MKDLEGYLQYNVYCVTWSRGHPGHPGHPAGGLRPAGLVTWVTPVTRVTRVTWVTQPGQGWPDGDGPGTLYSTLYNTLYSTVGKQQASFSFFYLIGDAHQTHPYAKARTAKALNFLYGKPKFLLTLSFSC